MSRKSDLPFGSEFSPSQIELPVLLELANKHAGDIKALQADIQQSFFSKHGGSQEKNREKLAMNCRLGMKAYGILNNEGILTEFGHQIYNLRKDEEALYNALARQILTNLHGMNLVTCIQDMTAAGEEVSLTTLRDGLASRGIHYPSGGKHPSMMRLWLVKAGVFIGSRWQIDDLRLKKVLGIDPNQFEVLASFSVEQRAFVRALANTGILTPQPANEIVRLASAIYGVKFPEKSLPKLVLEALVNAGYITAKKTTSGRGGKPFLVAPTSKLILEIIDPLLNQLTTQTDTKLRQLLKKPLTEIIKEVESSDRHIAGLALEALGFKLMRLIDMEYVATRLRGSETGGAEVDLIFHSKRLIYSRWQIQCKNTAYVRLDDVAKEVGLTHFLKSNVIIVVSTGDISGEARRYANTIMRESNLAIVMMDKGDLSRIITQAASIVDIFKREAHHAMLLKNLGNEK